MRSLYLPLLAATSALVLCGVNVEAQEARTVAVPEESAALVARVQNTGDAGANQLAAHILKNSEYHAVTIHSTGPGTGLMGLEVHPASNGKRPNDKAGVFHTQLRVFIPAGGIGTIKPPTRDQIATHLSSGAPYSGYPFNTPASLGCVYNLLPSGVNVTPASGCQPDTSLVNPSGGGGVIAIVDAFDTPSTVNDLQGFSAQFGLRPADFQIVYATGHKPASSYNNNGWDTEAELDVQWAHAMAPYAKIFLVEANSDSTDDLYAAVDVATSLVEQSGGGEVSMSFGGQEYSTEVADDVHFQEHPGVVYTTGAGDTNMVSYPAASPHVIAVGGTTIERDGNNNFTSEVVWNDAADGYDDGGGTGGGPSLLEPRPAYQQSVSNIVGTTRGTPDVSFNADPSSGVYVLVYGYWNIIGGTSLGAPATAAIINTATTLSKTRTSITSQAELIGFYSTIPTPITPTPFRDILVGTCGTEFYPPATPVNLSATPSYDMCSGIGTPQGYGGYGAPGGVKPKRQLPFIENGIGGIENGAGITTISKN